MRHAYYIKYLILNNLTILKNYFFLKKIKKNEKKYDYSHINRVIVEHENTDVDLNYQSESLKNHFFSQKNH